MTFRWKLAQWCELRWWKNYLSGKNKGAYLGWKKRYWNDLLSVIPFPFKDSSKTICDLGCGPAGIFIAFPENKVIAVDVLIDEYEKQIPFFRKADYPNVAFVQSTIEEFQPLQKFDVVFCMNVINHVRDIEAAFDKLKNICADDGLIILSVDAHNFSLFHLIGRLTPIDILHPHHYNLSDYQLFLETRGIKIAKTELLKKEFFFSHYLIVASKKNLLL